MKFDKESVEYIYDEISDLCISNFNEKGKNDYNSGKDYAYRECLRICTSILNNPLRLKEDLK